MDRVSLFNARGAQYWSGDPPVECDWCSARIQDEFVDCLTVHGLWASLCVGCAGELAVDADGALCRVYSRIGDRWVNLL